MGSDNFLSQLVKNFLIQWKYLSSLEFRIIARRHTSICSSIEFYVESI